MAAPMCIAGAARGTAHEAGAAAHSALRWGMKIGLVVPGFSANEQDWCIPALLDYVRALAAQAPATARIAVGAPMRRAISP